MESIKEQSNYFGTERIGKILFKMAPPVMLAQLIQALYNIVDSVFVGRGEGVRICRFCVLFALRFRVSGSIALREARI